MIWALQDTPSAEVADSLGTMWESFLEAIPRIGIAVVIVIIGWMAGRIVRAILRRTLSRNQTESFTRVMSKLAGWVVVSVGVLIALTVVFPSVAPVDLLAGLGIFSVAIGFAFQDILENLLAGVLLVLREPFHAGDQIEVDGHTGTVEEITIRETRIKTFDGQRVLVPNADVYKNAIVVRTAFEQRRADVVVGVAYEADLAEAQRIIERAVAEVDGVAADPAPEAFVTELGTSTVNFQLRFWTASQQHDLVETRDRAIRAVKDALDHAAVEMPADIVALQATPSLAAALHGGEVTPGGAVATG